MIDPILDQDEFRDQVCVVTGAARGIGAAIAESLARRAGTVIVADLNLDGAAERAEILRGAGHDAHPWRLDVSDPDQVDGLFADVGSRFGPPRVLVNNAGIVTVEPSHHLSTADWRRQVDVMLSGTFYASRAAARGMLASGGGAIVSLSSIGGFGGHPGRSAYNAAKAGISCLTQVLGSEWGERGIRVNAVAPAVTRTEMLEHVLRSLEGATQRAEYEDRTPMRRLGEPEEIAECVAFLASAKASFITGVTLVIDGGWMVSSGLAPQTAAGAGR
jgi:NAD(P)-dependent dehydrogenase (short-subunit alcohol dehydrogenase family)